jgi:hypothetical protein
MHARATPYFELVLARIPVQLFLPSTQLKDLSRLYPRAVSQTWKGVGGAHNTSTM